jgi:hypothetical protein
MSSALPAEMPRLSASGFSVYADTFAFEDQPGSGGQDVTLYFLSLLGPAQSTRAVWARLLKGELVTLAWEDARLTRFGRLAALGPQAWRMFSAGLPAAAGQQLVLAPTLALVGSLGEAFLLLPRSDAEAPVLHYQFLNRRTDLPLHACWAAWLWARAIDTGEARPLAARGLQAYHCRPDAVALAADVSRAVRQGRLALDAGHDRTMGHAA